MKTNSPPSCWQTDRETESGGSGRKRGRDRGACIERNEMNGMIKKNKKNMKAGCKEWTEKVRERESKDQRW